MKKAFVIVTIFCCSLLCTSFANRHHVIAEAGIKWLTWDELQAAEKKEPRKVVVDVYTGWCGWCKRMDASTYKDQEIIKYVSENFYAVKFDAEMRQTIHFKEQDYSYVTDGMRGYNQLAAKILKNQMSYPTTVYLDENMEEIFPVPGYRDPKDFEIILNYVATDAYKAGAFDSFNKSFKGKVK